MTTDQYLTLAAAIGICILILFGPTLINEAVDKVRDPTHKFSDDWVNAIVIFAFYLVGMFILFLGLK